MNIESNIKEYILKNFLFTDDASALNNETSLLEAGIVDSTGILDIIFYMEQKFGIKVDDEEMIPENLESVRNIVGFVTRKQLAVGA